MNPGDATVHWGEIRGGTEPDSLGPSNLCPRVLRSLRCNWEMVS